MEIKNNKEEVPFEYYLQRFRQMDPQDAVRRLEIPFDGGAFAIRFIDQTYTIAFAGKAEALRQACQRLGGTGLQAAGADVYCRFELFPFFPLQFRFWDADDEFPAQIRPLWDRNSLQFMHFETLYYVMGAFLGKLLRLFHSESIKGREI